MKITWSKIKNIKLNLRWKILIAVIAAINTIVLLVGLVFSQYRSLIPLFYYSFASNSPISWIVPFMPQEPILMFYGSFITPYLVALTAGLATFVIELINYQVLIPVFNLEQLRPFREKQLYQVFESYFNKLPFAIIAFVGFTPIPHLPFRLLAVFTKYSIVKYALASVVGRATFYYVVALTGTILDLPYWVYIISVVVIVALGFIIRVIRSSSKKDAKEETDIQIIQDDEI